MAETDIFRMTLEQISGELQRGQVSATELARTTLRHIEREDSKSLAIVTLMADRALEQAALMDKELASGRSRGPLHGVPIAVKDNIFTKGVRTASGSALFADFVPDADAETVRRLEQAGAVIVGKANMAENAYSTVGDRSYFGVPDNPLLPGTMTGGSSSGSAVCVAANLVYGSLGSDTGGSVRIPASACGIVGMKPTFGRVSGHGVHPLAWSLDHVGTMTRTVKDNALMLNAIQGYDAKDEGSIAAATDDVTADIGQSIIGRTIGVPVNFYFDIMQDEVRDGFEQAVAQLEKRGVRIVRIELPGMDELLKAHQLILAAEAYAVFEEHLRLSPDKIDPETQGKILNGKGVAASDYLRTNRRRRELAGQITQALRQVDVLMTPALCALPCKVNVRELDIQGEKHHTKIYARLTGPANSLGIPAIVVPGLRSGMYPTGVQFMGPALSERTLYQFAYAFEQWFA